MTSKKRTVCCYCGANAEVDSWNDRGMMVSCPYCGTFDLDRDWLYAHGMWFRSLVRQLNMERKDYERLAEDESLDEQSRSACRDVANMVGSVLDNVNDRERELWEGSE